ncbi:MAG: exodeoxyribonuclease VII small subunit [Candidatus Nanopelagicales bacterium]
MAELTDIMAWSATDIDALRYEQARDALLVVVNALEDAEVPLEELMKLWETGELLASACDALLTRARERIDSAEPSAG